MLIDDYAANFSGELNHREFTGTSWSAPVHVDTKGEGGCYVRAGGADWFFYVNGDLQGARIGA